MSGVGGAEGQQQRALLTLILAGSEDVYRKRRAMFEAFGFVPMHLAQAIVVLGHARSERFKALRPMVVRALENLAEHHPEFVTDELENRHDEGLPPDDSHGEPVSVVDAITVLHEAFAIETGADPRAVAPVLDRSYNSLITREVVRIEDLVEEINTRIQELDSSQEPVQAPPPPTHLAFTDEEGLPREVRPPETMAEAKASAAANGELTGTYEVAMATALGVDIEMVSAPACEDHAGMSESDAHSVEVSWTTKATIDQLAKWLDPATWPLATHGVFFKGMDLIGNKTTNGANWIANFIETVQFDENATEIKTNLHFVHGEDKELWDDANDPNTFRWSTYTLVDPTDTNNELLFDDGLLQLRRIEYDNGQVRVEGTCTKTFRFKAPSLDGYAELACDTWFGELAVMMSSNCGEGYPI